MARIYHNQELTLKIDNRQITSELNSEQLNSLAKMVNSGKISNFKKIEIIKK